MNSNYGGRDFGGSNEDVEADEARRDSDGRLDHEEGQTLQGDELRSPTSPTIPDDVVYRSIEDELGEEPDDAGDDGQDIDDVPDVGPRTPSPVSPSETASIPDDSPSLPGTPSVLPFRGTASPRGSVSRTPSGALQPFERRFQSRFSASPSPSPRSGSPAFLGAHSRQSSVFSQIQSQNSDNQEPSPAPWEVVRWTKLKKITGQAFSVVGQRQFGSPTCLAVSASIVLGTSKGLVLIFDYHQTLKSIIGQGTKAAESGPVASLAVAADYSTIGVGHASGNIFTWELAHPAKPFLHVTPVPRSDGQEQSADGHMPGRMVLHIGFLGTRHTALVSADDGGMAFSHLATRGLGAVARVVKTTRLLGRYPAAVAPSAIVRKPSSVLAFAPLPLGNIEQGTDAMGLTALLTPYLLVIVSTTPIAQTQHKVSRPKDVTPHSAISGCLAWFPAVKLKHAADGREVSDSKLVYCWSDLLTVMDVEIGAAQQQEKDNQPSLYFHQRAQWKCEEAIVAVQWLSRSVIGVLTISQRLVVIEDGALHAMDSVDLLQKHVYHLDVFSRQLHPAVEESENEAAIHGVVADAFFMGFRVYKGRLFLMGFSDLSVGILSNWADRLSALVEHGDDLAAIRLAMSYWTGDIGRVSVGLPEDPTARHDLVKDRLLDLLTASIKYRLAENDPSIDDLHQLAGLSFDACILMDEVPYLFDEIYEFFQDAGRESMLLDLVETYIVEDKISSLPPAVVQDLVSRYVLTNRASRLEEILCKLNPSMFDIDQITKLCRQHLLYDALVYVWTQALADWITPLIDLLVLVKNVDAEVNGIDWDHDRRIEGASKVFSYLAFALTGRRYPSGEPLDDDQADTVKAQLYQYLFSDTVTAWPPGSSSILRTVEDREHEPEFPYLHLVLDFDTASFMSMLNEAFEDPFLNSNNESDQGSSPAVNGGSRMGSRSSMSRNQIIGMLLDIMSGPEFVPEQQIFLDMFIARSLPKYPQFIILSGSTLQQVMHRLCTPPTDNLADECQLSVEYLLSVYHPSVTPELIELLRDAHFYRVLKSIYRSERRFVDLIKTYFEDPASKDGVFRDLSIALQDSRQAKQLVQLEDLICLNASRLAFVDLTECARTLSRHAPQLLGRFLEALGDGRLRFLFLRSILEPALHEDPTKLPTSLPTPRDLVQDFRTRYVQLMCENDPAHVADYINTLDSGDLQLSDVMPTLEENGVIDAAIQLLAKDGLARNAVDRLISHVQTLSMALCGLISSSNEASAASTPQEAVDDLLEGIEKYTLLGVWLCRGQTEIAHKEGHRQRHGVSVLDIKEDDLDPHEHLWLTLIDLIVSTSKDVSSAVRSASSPLPIDGDQATNSIRTLVQQTFTALLSATTARTPSANPTHAPHQDHAVSRPPTNNGVQEQSFLRILGAFLSRASLTAPSLSDLRQVLTDIFTAYAYETDVLTLASQLLGRDVFTEVANVHQLRQHGWRPRTQVCEECKRRAWGTGIGERVWDEWERSEEERVGEKMQKGFERDMLNSDDARSASKKGKSLVHVPAATHEPRSEEDEVERKKMVLVAFACRHVFHRECLDDKARKQHADGGQASGEGDEAGQRQWLTGWRYSCPLCDDRGDA